MAISPPRSRFPKTSRPTKYSLRLLPLVATLLIGTSANSQITLIKHGNPTWKPVGEFITSLELPIDPSLSDVENQRLFVSDLLGSAHVVQNNLERGYLAVEPHEGPHDHELREALLAGGGMDTTVFLASELRSPNRLFIGKTWVPSEIAPHGASPSSENGPVIPNEVLPIKRLESSLHRDEQLVGTSGCCSTAIQPLTEYGNVVDENGVQRDFTDLNWDQIFLPLGFWLADPIAGQYRVTQRYRDQDDNGWDYQFDFKVVDRDTRIPGDLNFDSTIDIQDLDILTRNVAMGSTHPRLDLNGDDSNNFDDVHYWVTDVRSTWIGDANLDGEFNSTDFIEVFKAGKYETGDLARWTEGDWNGDEWFDSSDFIVAFRDGGYEMGSRAAVAAVPEPSSLLMLTLGLLSAAHIRRRRGL